MGVHARPEEAREPDPVTPGQVGDVTGDLELGDGRWQVEPGGVHRGRDVGEERLDRVDSERGDHPLTLGGGMRTVGHPSETLGRDHGSVGVRVEQAFRRPGVVHADADRSSPRHTGPSSRARALRQGPR